MTNTLLDALYGKILWQQLDIFCSAKDRGEWACTTRMDFGVVGKDPICFRIVAVASNLIESSFGRLNRWEEENLQANREIQITVILL